MALPLAAVPFSTLFLLISTTLLFALLLSTIMPHSKATFLAAVLFVAVLGHTADGRALNTASRFTKAEAAAQCERTHHAKLCNSLTASPAATSPKLLVDVALDKAAIKAQHAYIVANRLLARPETAARGQLRSCLDACRESYDSLVDALRKAQEVLMAESSRDDLIMELSAAVTYVETCQDSFAEFPGVHSAEIDHLNRNLKRLVTNGLDLAANLH